MKTKMPLFSYAARSNDEAQDPHGKEKSKGYRLRIVVTSVEEISKSKVQSKVDRYVPLILSQADYFPLGLASSAKALREGGEMPERTISADSYRFGFNVCPSAALSPSPGYSALSSAKAGQGARRCRKFFDAWSIPRPIEEDYACRGRQGFRIYNPGLGRFLSVDPLTASYPMLTPYQFAGNKPIRFIDLDGLEESDPQRKEPEFKPPSDIQLDHSPLFEVFQRAKTKDVEKGYGEPVRNIYTLKVRTTKIYFDRLKNVYTTNPGIIQDNRLADYETVDNPLGNQQLEKGEGMIIDITGPFNGAVRFDNVTVDNNSFSLSATILEFNDGWFGGLNHPDAGHITFSGFFDPKDNTTVFKIDNETTIGNIPTFITDVITNQLFGEGHPRIAQDNQWKQVLIQTEDFLNGTETITRNHTRISTKGDSRTNNF